MIRAAAVALLAVQWFGGGEKNTREGAEHLENGRLEEALRAFSRAEGEHPEAPENDLNLAGVHYRMSETAETAETAGAAEAAGAAGVAGPGGAEGEGPLAEAARGYQAALAAGVGGELRRDGFFNLGNALFRAGAFREAAAAYGEAISLDPEDLEARQNLERALLRAEEQQAQQQQQQPQGGGEQDSQPENREGEGDPAGSGDDSSGDEPSGGEPSGGGPEGDSEDSGGGEPPEADGPEGAPPEDPGAPERENASGADAPSGEGPGQVPEISPEQAERILAALAEVEQAFQEARLEQRRARALRRGRH